MNVDGDVVRVEARGVLELDRGGGVGMPPSIRPGQARSLEAVRAPERSRSVSNVWSVDEIAGLLELQQGVNVCG